jgi:hypothetical protein
MSPLGWTRGCAAHCDRWTTPVAVKVPNGTSTVVHTVVAFGTTYSQSSSSGP